MSCKLGKINPHLVKSYCLPSMFCYFSNTLYITQMAASIIKALFELISVAVHFSTGHVSRESFNFLKISFPWELLNFEVNIGNVGIPWTWKAQEKKHRMSNQTNLVVTQYCHARKCPEKISITNVQPAIDWFGLLRQFVPDKFGLVRHVIETTHSQVCFEVLNSMPNLSLKNFKPTSKWFFIESRLGLHQLSVKRMQEACWKP